jgi:hypothetical protein
MSMKRTALLTVIVIPVIVAVGFFAHRVLAEDDLPENSAAAQPAPYQLVEIASGLTRPLYVTHAGDGSGRPARR